MLRCYLLAIASGSSVDQVSNNLSLFNLVEQVKVSDELLGQVLPFEAHIYWFVSEQGHEKDFEVRVVRVPVGGGEDDPGTIMPFRSASTNRVRFRSGGFRLPNSYGQYVLAVEWRVKGEEFWNRESATWPLVIEGGASARQSVVPPGADVEGA